MYIELNDIIEVLSKYNVTCPRIKGYLFDMSLRYTSDNIPGYLSYYSYERDTRVVTKTGRLIRKMFPSFSDKQVLDVTSDINAAVFKSNLNVFRGRDIVNAYNRIRIPGNCMQQKGHITEFYAQQSNVELWTVETHKGDARCLVWTLSNGTTYGDRIFGNSEYAIALLEGYVIDSCDNWRTHNGYPDPDCDDMIENHYDEHICLDYAPCNYMPYMDTFCFVCHDVCVMQNYMDEEVTRLAISTSGDMEKVDRCCKCHVNIDLVVVNGQYYCKACRSFYFETCDDCGQYVTKTFHVKCHDIRICACCRDRNYTLCTCCNEYARTRDIHRLFIHGERSASFCSKCASEFKVCVTCRKRFHKDTLFCSDSGFLYCQKCKPLYTSECRTCHSVFTTNGYSECYDCAAERVYQGVTL